MLLSRPTPSVTATRRSAPSTVGPRRAVVVPRAAPQKSTQEPAKKADEKAVQSKAEPKEEVRHDKSSVDGKSIDMNDPLERYCSDTQNKDTDECRVYDD